LRLSVIGVVSDFEYDQAIEDRDDALNLLRHVLRPQLKLTTPFRLPGWFQIEERVQTSMSLQLVVPIEIRVDLKEFAVSRRHCSAANEVGIGDEAVDP